MPPPAREFAEFNGLLASAVEKNLPLAPAVRLMAGVVRDRRLSESLAAVSRSLDEGASLPDALARHPETFPSEYVALVRAGLEGGRLAEVLRTAETHQAMTAKVRNRMTKLVLYLLAGAVIGELVLLITVIAGGRINEFNQEMYRQMEIRELPKIQRIIRDILEDGWILLLAWPGAIAAGCVLYVLTQRYSRLSRLGYMIPVWGRIRMSRDLALFCCATGLKLRSGSTVPEALQSARDSVGNHRFRAMVDRVRRRVSEGESLSSALFYDRFFPKTLAWGVSLGEENGEVPRTFDAFASLYTSQMERNFTILQELLTPLGILVVGNVALLSALLILSPFLSIIQMSSMF